MCPTFCMTVKDGCYVCDCGKSQLGYLSLQKESRVQTNDDTISMYVYVQFILNEVHHHHCYPI